MSIESMKLPPSEREAFEAFAQNCPMGKYSIARRGDGYDSSHTQLMWDAWQARAQVQGEPFGYIHHFAAHDERGALIDTTWEADGSADPLPHPTSPAMWKWSHCTPFYTTQRPTQATQATDYVGVEPDGIVIGFHEGNALVDHAGNLEEGNCLFLSPTIPTQATQAEVTDEEIEALFGKCGGHWSGDQWVIEDADLHPFARTILALRPEREESLRTQVDLLTAAVEARGREIAKLKATGEPVQADSSEYLRVIASLGAALRRLSFAAQTTGGTDGPDAELQSAIGQAEQALSMGGIWQAMSATSEPVARSEREQLRHAQAAVVMPMIGPLLDAWENSDREVMSQEPELSKQLKNINSAMEDADTHPAPSVPADVVRDAERYRWLRGLDHWPAPFLSSQEPEPVRVRDLDAAIDAAMLAAK